MSKLAQKELELFDHITEEDLVQKIERIIKSTVGFENCLFSTLDCTNHRYKTILIRFDEDFTDDFINCHLEYYLEKLNKTVDILFEGPMYYLNTYINLAIELKNGKIIGHKDVDYLI